MKFSVYAFVSTIVLLGTVLHTYIQQEHFYPTLVALSEEKLQLAVIYNFLFMVLVVIMRVLVALFVGKLTPIETEQLVENGRSMVADTLLFLIFYSPTINGREISTVYLVQFIGVILILKVFHSISQIRTGRMFEVGVPTNTMIARVGLLLLVLVSIDLSMISHVSSMLEPSSTFYTWLLFEFINVSISSLSTLLKFGLNFVDAKLTVQGWPTKSVYIFYTDLLSDILQMTSYIMFMGIFFYQNPSRLPIYAIADVLQVARQLASRLRSFKKYREITSNMEGRFPNATPEEMATAESCIICRDSLQHGCKVLQCGHIFHTECLKNWAVVQQICPTCRADLIPKTVVSTVPPPVPQESTPQTSHTSPPASSSSADVQPKEGSGNTSPEPRASPIPASRTIVPLSPAPAVPVAVASAAESNVSVGDLLKAIEHARTMADFYREQASFWAAEVKGIQQQAMPVGEPESLRRVIEGLRSSVATPEPAPVPGVHAPSESELKQPEADWEEIRAARRRRYEEEVRNQTQ